MTASRAIAITGASGLLGAALWAELTRAGDRPVALVRPGALLQPGAAASAGATIRWDPQAGTVDRAALEGVDAVVHLAGENIAAGRWTEERKRRIEESRRLGTRTIATAVRDLATPPKVLISASAVGYYGDRGDEVLTEESSPGSGFLADVCRVWEDAALPVLERGVRLVIVRIGVVISRKGGMLPRILVPFKAGLGGPVGSGLQYLSWIALDDVVGAIRFALETETLFGPVNLTGPEPVTSRDLAKTLGKVLRRPAILPAPTFALRIALGEMADQLLLSSARAMPAKLRAAGYPFLAPTLEAALLRELAPQPGHS
ncbi:MAG: TIGR01777 family oxidoreductase [Deltaproteobacteria bacterium]|nr:TIGR01777 family oxidoreductase [Deltaproteobacteria bacterium]